MTPTANYSFSRSQFGDFLRCRKRYEYRHIQDIDDMGPGSIPMRFGTIGHYGLAAGYEALRQLQENQVLLGKEAVVELFSHTATEAMASLIQSGVYKYRGQEQPLGINHQDHADVITTMGDVVQYYAQHMAWEDFMRYKFLPPEQEYSWQFAVNISGDVFIAEISGVMDLCAIDTTHSRKMLTVFDHKFVGDVNGTLSFLPLDVQMLVYEAIVGHHATEVMGYDSVELQYNMIRRDVPPGFGHRSELTKSGAKSTASRRVEDYLRRELLFHSTGQRERIESYFLRPTLTEMVRVHEAAGPFLLSPDKVGCGFCPYRARCGANLVGAGQPRFVTTKGKDNG